MMIAHDLVELSLRDGDVEVNLRRPHGNAAPEIVGGSPPATVAAASAATPDPEDAGTFVEIPSPMVGTFYASPDPDSSSFVKVGSRVQSDTIVCIVEAMKVFNEIKAEVSGVIDRILVKNEQAIEYGQPLFSVRTE
ncbi:MAG: acetyl-CoA carboxylase biotin carboxyl carrier protein [Planctomycetes bacterium]|nr:acetyl-CoA carboxylase biotin carboxyl carrier protein [Planctomycetota bacterium]